MPDRPGPGDDDPLDVVALGPGILAGFTSRVGGRSGPPWQGLNVGRNVGDAPAVVEANRRVLADRLGAPVVFARQVHGADVAVVTGRPDGDGDEPPADALVTAVPDLAVGVYVADCVPVLLADPVAGVVAAAHAGRPGLVAGVLQAAVAAMVRAGADPRRMRAAVGPCIAGPSYEVPGAMRDEVAAVVPEAACVTSSGTPAVDLAAGVLAVLGRCGVEVVHVDGRDTYAHPDLYSHRRAVHAGAPATGRSAGVVRLLPGSRPPRG